MASPPAPPYAPSSPQAKSPTFAEDWERSMQHDVSPETTTMAQKKASIGAASDISNHPDILSPGMETIHDTNEGKEVVYSPPMGQYAHYDDAEKFPAQPPPTDRTQPRRRICGMTIPLCLAILAFILIALAIGLGVGLGVGLKKNSNGGSQGTDGNTFNPAWLSTTGAFNGTGLAIASQSFADGGYGRINVYFQHNSGQIRRLQLMDNGDWSGGDQSNIVAIDARNATPISAVAYAMDNKATWHIFYIDQKNIVREKINDNTTNQWRDGPIGDLNLIAMNDTNVGLQACWYGSFYGNANYTHSPIPGTGTNTTSQDQVIGMHLWYGANPQLLQEVTWTYNTTDWYKQDTFVANGHAGIACYSWGPGSVSYMMNVNLDNEVQIAWKDLNSSIAATDAHPINKWVNISSTIPSVAPNSSLGYTNFFFLQQQDAEIAGYNISWDAENTALGDVLKIPQIPLLGTHFSVTALPTSSGGNQIVVLDQTNGTDITFNARDLQSGSWTYASLPVPKN